MPGRATVPPTIRAPETLLTRCDLLVAAQRDPAYPSGGDSIYQTFAALLSWMGAHPL